MRINSKIESVKKLYAILFDEKENMLVFIIYAAIISLLYLAIPLAAQVLVNVISTGVLLQPIIMITTAVFIGLLFLGILRIFQLFIAEIIQRKIFAKIALQISQKLPQISQKYLGQIYAPELVNRFFDVITIQKTLTLILLEVPSAIFQILLGFILMGIYSPLLIIFDTLLILTIVFVYSLGYNGINSSKKQSNAKYKVAHWLEELARCQISFKMNQANNYAMNEVDERIINYVDKRKEHFQVLFRQYSASFFIAALASASVLAIGGWLVMQGKLSLGQLVASELVILMIVSSLDKIVQKFESWYDLLTAIDKVSLITDLETERKDGIDLNPSESGLRVVCDDLSFSYNEQRKVLDKIKLELEPGSKKSLVGVSGAGKPTFAYLLSGLQEFQEGNLLLNNSPIKGLKLSSIRENIALVIDYNEIFAGTIEENIILGRNNLNKENLDEVIEMVHLERDIKQFPLGIKTSLLSEGRNISLGQRQRILLARALITKPKLLILDEAFGGMDEKTKLTIINNIFDTKQPWTILNITHDAEVVLRTNYIYLLDQGKIIEEGNTKSLLDISQTQLSILFPDLHKILKGASLG